SGPPPTPRRRVFSFDCLRAQLLASIVGRLVAQCPLHQVQNCARPRRDFELRSPPVFDLYEERPLKIEPDGGFLPYRIAVEHLSPDALFALGDTVAIRKIAVKNRKIAALSFLAIYIRELFFGRPRSFAEGPISLASASRSKSRLPFKSARWAASSPPFIVGLRPSALACATYFLAKFSAITGVTRVFVSSLPSGVSNWD